jgi:hypothetical protein
MTSVAKAYDTPVTPTMTVQSVEKLAAVISKNAAILNQQVIEKNLVPPTVNDISPPSFLELDDATSKELIQAARELQTIVQGPSQVLSILGFAVSPAMTVDPKCSAIRLTFVASSNMTSLPWACCCNSTFPASCRSRGQYHFANWQRRQASSKTN